MSIARKTKEEPENIATDPDVVRQVTSGRAIGDVIGTTITEEEIRAAGCPVEINRYASVLAEDYGILSEFPGPAALPLIIVRRAVLQRTLIAYADRAGVPFRWGHNMESLEQTEGGVKVRFANGVVEEGSFVVGCDGLHSNVRKTLFGDAKADFTGIACVRSNMDMTLSLR